MNFSLFAQQMQEFKIEEFEGAGGFQIPMWFWVLYGAILLIYIVATWQIFVKAGRPGWHSLIPFYNMIVLLQMAGMSGWMFLALCIPVVGFIVGIVWLIKFLERFGKGAGYIIGMILLPFIFWPMLAFGDARYTPPPPTR